jgi:hypothetical protein
MIRLDLQALGEFDRGVGKAVKMFGEGVMGWRDGRIADPSTASSGFAQVDTVGIDCGRGNCGLSFAMKPYECGTKSVGSHLYVAHPSARSLAAMCPVVRKSAVPDVQKTAEKVRCIL